jgi:exonuclease III
MEGEQCTIIAVWNARGLNNPARRAAVKVAVANARASLVCISETKLHAVTAFDIVECFGPHFDGFIYLPTVGSTGGVLIAWVSQSVRVLSSHVDRFSVSVQLCCPGGSSRWLTSVYGPNVADLKSVFLDELRQLQVTCTGPWAVAGDFNLILAACDKNTLVVDRRSMGMFRRCVNDLELREAPLLGRRFTWSNERASPTLVKLDQWFASVEWNELYPEASLSVVSSSLSDHCPILMIRTAQSFIGRWFRFNRFWWKLEGFADVVKALWDDPSGDMPADPLRRLDFKLRRTSRGLQSWSQRKVGSIRDLILVANEVISRLNVAQEGRQLSVEEHDLHRGLKLKVLGLASLERTISRQRARVAGTAEGDASSKFFRIMASARRSHNNITALRSGEQVVTDLPGKVELATDYFVQLLGRVQPTLVCLSRPWVSSPWICQLWRASSRKLRFGRPSAP